jgi:hypothetical protein
VINLTKTISAGWLALTLATLPAYSQEEISPDTARVHHRLAVETRPEYVFGTNDFLRGLNTSGKSINYANSFHLTYSFRYNPGSKQYSLYGDSYQGIGLGLYSYNDKSEIGSPFTIYVFQGSRLARLGQRASLNYEWGFGLSCGWHPHNMLTNPYNGGVGSQMNAYINAGIYLDFVLTRHLDLIAGASFTHFSNGNTSYPNAGINNGGGRIGVVYYMNRNERKLPDRLPGAINHDFRPHLSYDLTLFGAWRHGYTTIDGERYSLRDTYPVAGLSFATMYDLHRKFRAGLSLDATYDGSGNLRIEDPVISELGVVKSYSRAVRPGFGDQLSVGLSARFEYVMPFFTIAAGMGHNFIHSTGDMRGFYQTLALKIRLSEALYLNVGYNLKDFRTPNHLMLGMGWRFGSLRSKGRVASLQE